MIKTEARFQPAIDFCLENFDQIAGAIFHLKKVDLNEEDAFKMGLNVTSAATDGCCVWTTEMLKKYTRTEQRFIFLHEMCHAIFQHAPRAAVVRKQSISDFHPMIWNYAADAMINQALNTGLTPNGQPNQYVDMPEGLVTFGDMMVKLKRSPDTSPENVNKLLSEYSTEQLYYEILKVHKQECMQKKGPSTNSKGKKDKEGDKGSGKGDKDEGEGKDGSDYPNDPGRHSSKCPCSGGKALGDVIEQPGDSEKSAEEHIDEWKQVQNQLRGMNPAFYERLAGEFPKIDTPWQQILRDFLYRLLGPRVETNYSRPSRRYSALEGDYHHLHGIDFPFEPAHDRPKMTGRIGVVLDTSGSIGEALLNRFLAEIATVLEVTDSEVCIIVCDADVHEVHEVERGADSETLRNLKYSGGGGTAFEPGIAKAVESKVDAIIYLTDLYGSFGKDPGIPIMWAVPKESNSTPEQPPFGKLLLLT